MKKTRKSILVWLLSLVMATLLVSTGITAFAADGGEGEPATGMPEEVEITKVETTSETTGEDPDTKTTYYLHVTFNLPEGEFTSEIATATGSKYLYYNYLKGNDKVDNKNRINGYKMISANVLEFKLNAQPDPVVDDVVTFIKGFNIPMSDGSTAYLEHTQKWKNTADGWVNLTAQQKETEPKLRFELMDAAKNTATVGGGFGTEFIRVYNKETGAKINPPTNYNDSNWMNCVEVKEYVEYHGANGSTALPGWIRYATDLRLGNDDNHTFVKGDEITFLKGLHFCNGGGNWGADTAYANHVYEGYLDETITLRCTGSGWIVKSVGPMKLGSANAIVEQDATMALPTHYKFNIKFSNIVADVDADGLEEVDAFAEKILIGGKSVKALNEEITDIVNDDEEPVKAVYLSASSTDVTVTMMKDSRIWDGASTLSLSVLNGFVADSGNYTEADATLYYLSDLGYWSTVEPYAVTRKDAIDINYVSEFEIIDSGANGDITVVFTDAIADSTILWYNCLPAYRLTLPAPYAPQDADLIASADAYFSFLSHIEIDGTTLASRYAGEGSAESKSSTYQCHIGAVGGNKNALSLRAAVSTWSGTEPITIVFKSGLVFASGNYLDHDITIKYTPAEEGETTVYEVTATAVELVVTGAEATAANTYEIKVDDTLNVSAKLNPVSANNAELVYVIGDETVVSLDGGVLTALKAGTTTIKVTYGTLESATVTITVTEKQTTPPGGGDDNPGGNQGGDDKKDPEPTKKKGCGSDLATDALVASVVLLAAAGVILVIRKKVNKAN